MLPVALQAARAIEERLYEDASATERALLSHFLLAVHRRDHAIIVLGERVELSTPPAARLLDVADKTLLWERASNVIEKHSSAKDTFALTDGREVTATFSRVDVDGRAAGVVIELRATAEAGALSAEVPSATCVAGRRDRTTDAPSPFLGRSSASRYLREQADNLGSDLMPILIVGEAGVGKLTLAKAIAGDRTERVLIDAARITIDGENQLLRQVAEIADAPGKTIIVRRVGCLSAQTLQALTSIANTAESNASRILVTATVSADEEQSPIDTLMGSFGLRLEVPPLRERSDDLVDLIPYLIERRGATARMAPAAIQALMRYEWPGNVRELDGLVRAILTRKRTADIVTADLPPAYQPGSRRLRRIEHVERAAIVQALLEASVTRPGPLIYWRSVEPRCTGRSGRTVWTRSCHR